MDDSASRVAGIPARLLIHLVRGYQLFLSPHVGGSCRFEPTCSNYAIEALAKYGALKGTILAVHRILRCNPWGGHGHDPPRWYGEPRPDDDTGRLSDLDGEPRPHYDAGRLSGFDGEPRPGAADRQASIHDHPNLS